MPSSVVMVPLHCNSVGGSVCFWNTPPTVAVMNITVLWQKMLSEKCMSPIDSTSDTHTHTRSFNSPFSGTTCVSWYQKGKTNLDFIEAKDSEWQWRQLGHMQVCTSLQFLHQFLQAECPSCRQTNSVKALKAIDSTSNA